MKITNKGYNIKETTYKFYCNLCKTSFEASGKEFSYIGYNAVHINCPSCHKNIIEFHWDLKPANKSTNKKSFFSWLFGV